jgi:Carboxypeptidase regulatory-like domain
MNVFLLHVPLLMLLQNSPISGSLQGVVVKAGTSEAIPNARVELRRVDVGRGANYATTAQENGRFSFRNLRDGRYQLVATSRGYIAVKPPTLTIEAEKEQAGIRVPMTLAGVIYGHVYDEQRRPLANAEVDVVKLSIERGQRTFEFNRSLTTNDLGEYRAFWLTPGRYYVSALHPDAGRFQSATGGFGGYMLQIRQAVTIQLPETRASADYVPIFAPSTTDDQDAQAIDVGPGAEIGGIDIMVFPVQKRVARGVVVDSGTGQPVRNAQLFVTRDPARFNDMPYIGVDSSNGAFEVSSLLPGSYAFLAIAGPLSRRITVDIGEQNVSNLIIPLQSGIGVRGQVTMDEGNPAGMRVSLRPLPEIPNLKMTGPPDNGVVTRGGSFSLSAVPPGEYRLDVTFPANLQSAFVKSAPDIVRVTEDQSEPLQIEIGSRGGTLNGRVLDTAQQPVAGVTAVLMPGYRTATADGSGRFHFDRLPAGDYRLFASDEVDGSLYEAGGTAVRVVEGTTANADVVFMSEDQ